MTDFGITSTGFQLKRLADILLEFETTLGTVEDPVSGEKFVPAFDDENDPITQIVHAFSDSLALAWEQLQLAYNQFDPVKASGAGLSGIVQLNGITRLPGVPASLTIELTGIAGTTLPAGRQVTTEYDWPVFELPAVVLEAGTTTVTATCMEDGPVDVNPYTVTKILTPVSGWSTATNPTIASVGTLEESDIVLRARQQLSTSYPAQTIVEAIAAAIANLDGVDFVKVYQNKTLATDSRGIPAKSIAAIIQGGEDSDIAQAMFEKLACGGADSYGDTTFTISDNQGIGYDISFSRPTAVEVYVEIVVEVVNLQVWPDDGEESIKSAIITWAEIGATGIGIGSDTNYDQNGYTPGQTVYASELIIPCYSVAGIRVVSLEVGIVGDSSPLSDEITIAWNEIAQFSTDNISISVV